MALSRLLHRHKFRLLRSWRAIGMVGLEPADEIVQQVGSVREDAVTL